MSGDVPLAVQVLRITCVCNEIHTYSSALITLIFPNYAERIQKRAPIGATGIDNFLHVLNKLTAIGTLWFFNSKRPLLSDYITKLSRKDMREIRIFDGAGMYCNTIQLTHFQYINWNRKLNSGKRESGFSSG